MCCERAVGKPEGTVAVLELLSQLEGENSFDRYDTYGLGLAVEKSVSVRFTLAIPLHCILRHILWLLSGD